MSRFDLLSNTWFENGLVPPGSGAAPAKNRTATRPPKSSRFYQRMGVAKEFDAPVAKFLVKAVCLLFAESQDEQQRLLAELRTLFDEANR